MATVIRCAGGSCHCLLVETPESLVLVDTGFGLRDVADPTSRLSRFFLTLLSPDFREECTAIRQIEKLGFKAKDVRHIVLTHLDFDHAGGLDDFPHATVHLLNSEIHTATAQRTILDRMRYRAQQWGHRRQWRGLKSSTFGERWFGFECARNIPGLSTDIVLVSLIGHTLGHAGVAIDRGRQGWLFQTGDAYFFHREMDAAAPYCTPGLRFYQWMMEKDREARLINQERLRRLKREHGNEVFITNSHDMQAFKILSELDGFQVVHEH